MKKAKFVCALAALLAALCALSVLAADIPTVTDSAVAYISYNNGNNDYSGLSADEAKKMMAGPKNDGVVSLVPNGGKIIACGKIFLGASYKLPKLGGTLLITSNDGQTNYLTELPADNPATSLKMAAGAVFTLQSDVILDDLILFNEYSKNNTIKVTNGATLVIGDGVICKTNPNLKAPAYMHIEVEEGATAILQTGIFQSVTGDGTILNYGAMVIEGDVPVIPAAPSFKTVRTYQNQFADVAEKQWFYAYVKTAYEYGLANGTADTKFSPDGKFTVAQALTVAANIHAIYNGKTVNTAGAANWYDPYVSYCVANGIITASQFDKYDRAITRGEMAVVFAGILPESSYTAVRDGSFPDVKDGDACRDAVLKLYRAGLVGGDDKGNFNPANGITRAEACVIFTRIAAAEYRAK